MITQYSHRGSRTSSSGWPWLKSYVNDDQSSVSWSHVRLWHRRYLALLHDRMVLFIVTLPCCWQHIAWIVIFRKLGVTLSFGNVTNGPQIMENLTINCLWHFRKIGSKGGSSHTVCAGCSNRTVLRTSSWIGASLSSTRKHFPYHSVPCRCFTAPSCAAGTPLTMQTPPPLRHNTPVLSTCLCEVWGADCKTQATMRRGAAPSTKFYLESLWLKCEGTYCGYYLC